MVTYLDTVTSHAILIWIKQSAAMKLSALAVFQSALLVAALASGESREVAPEFPAAQLNEVAPLHRKLRSGNH